MVVPSPVGDVKIVSSSSTFVLNTLTLKKSAIFFYKNMSFRDLLDQYAACGSSREVVEVQDKWLQECEKEQEQRASQGI